MRARIVAAGVGMGLLLTAFLWGLSGVASAQPGPYAGTPTPSVVTPPSTVSPSTAAQSVAGEPKSGEPTSSGLTFTTGEPSGLAFTGADIAGMTIFGIAAVGIGGALVYRSRRRRVVA